MNGTSVDIQHQSQAAHRCGRIQLSQEDDILARSLAMKIATLAWLVVLLFCAGTSGTLMLPEEEEKEKDSSNASANANAMKNAGVLKDLMQSECLNRTANYNGRQSFHFYLATMFNTTLVKYLYDTAIRQLLEHQSYEAVASYVWDIHQNDGAATFALMAEMQTIVFSHFMFNVNFDDSYRKYRMDLAYYLYRIRNSELFVDLDSDVKYEVEYAIKLLPEDLQVIFFSPQFCLRNRRFYTRYLYSTPLVKDGRRKIIIAPRRSSTLPPLYIWRRTIVDALADGVAIKGRANFAVFLYSTKISRNYIYLDRTKADGVIGWANGQPADGSLWRMHYVSSAMMFEQQGIYLCATDVLDDEVGPGNFVDGIATSSDNRKCRWAVGRCD